MAIASMYPKIFIDNVNGTTCKSVYVFAFNILSGKSEHEKSNFISAKCSASFSHSRTHMHVFVSEGKMLENYFNNIKMSFMYRVVKL